MAKQTPAERFAVGLFAAFPGSKTDEHTRALYRSKLARWSCSEEVWARALSRLVADHQFLPTLAEVFGALKACERDAHGGGSSSGAWELWDDAQGRRYCRRVDLDRDQPAAPEGAGGYHLAVDQPFGYGPVSREEARVAFRCGWIESGADPGKCDGWFRRFDVAREAAA